MSLLLAVIAAASPASSQEHAHDAVGAVHFDVSCTPEVRPAFDRAVALLHHMMYVEAKRAFEDIAAKDPTCAMARWGIAMTGFQPLWPTRPSPDDIERGRTEIEKAKSLAVGGDRERDLIAATEAFYADQQADYWTRIARWADGMRKAHQNRPDDVETAAFYALSELAVGQTASDRLAHNGRAASVLLRLYEREPTHPGAIHYTIHANDVDARASESLDVVQSYSRVAPAVPHALHMPTHIFVRLGAWPDVIQWNAKSAEAALNFPAGDAISYHYIHAIDYLVYAHLQRGEDTKAREAYETAAALGRHQPSFIAAWHLAAMPARLAVERRAWDDAAALEPRSPDYLAWDDFVWPEALTWLARGLGAVHTGDLEGARRAESRMRELRDRADNAGEQQFRDFIEVDRRILAAHVAQVQGNADSAVTLARSAAELESTLEKHPVSPGAIVPAYEALGDLLCELDRCAEALAAYRASLETWPNRFHSLLGAARAARASGDAATAKRYYAELLDLIEDAETDREVIGEARDYTRKAPGG